MIEMEPGTVYLFRSKVQDLVPDEDRFKAFLSDREQARAARFRFDRDWLRFTLATGWLRWVLGQARGDQPSHLTFEYGDHGKPTLPGGPAFNLSHSGDQVLLGVAGAGRLGVDIEVVRPMDDLEGLARKHFADEEVRALRGLPSEDRLRAFFRGWTRKEAFIKGLGRGLSVPLDSFAVDLSPNSVQALRRADLPPDEEGDWVVLPVPVNAEAEAAIAWDLGTPSIVEGAGLLP
jgi:4'-phosphopantetheinyl transferase